MTCGCGCGRETTVYRGEARQFVQGHRAPSSMEDLCERFDRSVVMTASCWLWCGPTQRGYGMFSANGTARGAHRFAWEREHGAIPDGMCVCHRCDVPACVNPDHLFLGTQQDNMRDMVRKGRQPRTAFYGEEHGCARLTNDQVYEIRSRYDAGQSPSTLAPQYEMTPTSIVRIGKRRSWKHLEEVAV